MNKPFIHVSIFHTAKYAIILGMLLLPDILHSQITFYFTPSQNVSITLRDKMNKNISSLLTEINRAGMSHEDLTYIGIDIENGAKERLNALWYDAKFICNHTINSSLCYEDHQGYQARDIPITMLSSDQTEGLLKEREITISLNKQGVITGLRLAWEIQQSKESILKSSSVVSDARERYEILKWLEDFRCYYNEKNIKALNQIYSDDALIITGSVVLQKRTSSDFNKAIENNANYKIQSKQEYLYRLSDIFRSNRKIKVEFDSIEVRRHGSRPHIYGVTLRQKWNSGSYRDEGWLFLLWDFNNPDYPQIYVRTWQPVDARKEERPTVYSFPYSN